MGPKLHLNTGKLQCNYCNGGPLRQSWLLRLHEITIHSMKLVVGQSAARKKQKTKKLLKAQIKYRWQTLFKKAQCFMRQCFSIWNLTCNTKETHLFDTSCYFCHVLAISSLPLRLFEITSWPQVKNLTGSLGFFPWSSTLMDLSENIGFLQWVQKVTSVGCSWLISIHVVYLD